MINGGHKTMGLNMAINRTTNMKTSMYITRRVSSNMISSPDGDDMI